MTRACFTAMLGSVINVLFVCIGNSCRSQMAEGFARKYGSDVMRAWSAGLAPAGIVQPMTIQMMDLKNIDIRDQFPKSVDELELSSFEAIINLSGLPLPVPVPGDVFTWKVQDPMLQSEEVYIAVRDQIEGLVMQMILDLRRALRKQTGAPVTDPVRPSQATVPLPVPTPVPDKGDRSSESSQRFGFGRIRRNRD